MPDHAGPENTADAPHPGIGGIRLCLGGNVFGWTLDRDGSFPVLDAFYEAGGRMIDSAEGYSSWIPGNEGGESETIIGEWMESRGVRQDMLIATKTGMDVAPFVLKPERVAAAMEGSLERLRTDYIDLYYAHRDDNSTPLDEVISGYDDLVKAGKAREIGASNYTVERLGAITKLADRMGMTPFTVLQQQFNLVARSEYQGPLQALCVQRDIAVLPYYGLAAGFLSGKFRKEEDWAGSPRAHALIKSAQRGGFDVLAVMDTVAAETGATLAQIALAWLNTQPAIAAPIVSATTPAQIADLLGAARLELSEDQVARLSGALPG